MPKSNKDFPHTIIVRVTDEQYLWLKSKLDDNLTLSELYRELIDNAKATEKSNAKTSCGTAQSS